MKTLRFILTFLSYSKLQIMFRKLLITNLILRENIYKGIRVTNISQKPNNFFRITIEKNGRIMIEVNELDFLENTIENKNQINLDNIFQKLLDNVQQYLNLKPFHKRVQVRITKNKNVNIGTIFSVGVNRYNQNGILILEINEDYKKYLNFILLREIYNLFMPDSLKNYEIIHIIINKIIMTHFTKFPLLNEWRALIRGNLVDYDTLSKGVNRLFEFDRLGNFLKSLRPGAPHDPIQFFFKYIKENTPIINDKLDCFHEIFFQEFSNYIMLSERNDEIIDTVRCLIDMFYELKNYTEILKYKDYFLEFKESGIIETELSQRQFILNMDWLKKNSYIAPSYQLNWNMINISIVSIFIRFNPLLKKTKIYEVIDQFPFFVSPKVSYDSFSVDLAGYIVIPNIYLDDFYKFIEKLEDFGYIIKHFCLLFNQNRHIINLNYFRDFSKKHRVINPNNSQYNKKYEEEFVVDFSVDSCKNDLSFLDFLVLDRIRFYSVSGLGFERRSETLNEIKSDLLNGIITERSHINNLKKGLNFFSSSIDRAKEFTRFLETNKKFGFFYIKKMLETTITLFNYVKKLLIDNPHIHSFSQFKEAIINQNLSHQIEDRVLLKKLYDEDSIIKNLLTDFFQSKKTYREKMKILSQFSNFINNCQKLKIYSINSIKKIINDEKVINEIYKSKEERLKNNYEKWKLYKITFQEIEKIIDKFINSKPPIIQPLLINTLIFDEKDYLELVLFDTKETHNFIESLKTYFPRILINNTEALESNENLIYVEISTPYMTEEEKEQFYSIIYNSLKDNIHYGKSYLWKGWIPALSRKNFYDFESNQFFYTEDLYKQFFLYVQYTFGVRLKPSPNKSSKPQKIFWSKEKYFSRLIRAMNYYDSKENIDLNLANLTNLLSFNANLKSCLLNPEKLRNIKTEYFYKNYVKSIKCIPAFQHFKLEEFYLYVYPIEIERFDFKVLLSNTFQKIHYPACIDGSNSFLIKYIMPYHFPNKKYINWLTKAKKNIREYIAFSVRKVHRILHFSSNLGSNGWEYNPDKFKIYFQNILFNPTYKEQIPETQTFDLDEIIDSKSMSPNSIEFESLTQVYGWHSIDLKTYVGANKYSIENHITELLKKKYIFPYLSLRKRNLGIKHKIHIILPKLKKDDKLNLIRVFNYFNIGYIYEIEGEFFISGFDREIIFENGLMIKLYLPKCNIGEFEKLFDLLFQYLDISHYLILNDLVNGSNLIKSIYGDLNFLKEYNPLKNLKWSEKDKVWLNYNILSKTNGFIYPELIPNGCEKHE